MHTGVAMLLHVLCSFARHRERMWQSLDLLVFRYGGDDGVCQELKEVAEQEKGSPQESRVSRPAKAMQEKY